jgi:hypothetical protein
MKIAQYISCILLVLSLCITSCKKQDAYKKYVEGGEIIYPARIDSLIVKSGNKRILLRAALSSDASITRVKAYWNSRADSLEKTVVRTGGKDTVDLMITNLEEGAYNFEAVTYNDRNNVSVVMYGAGNAYGDTYQGSLANRTIKSIDQTTDGKLNINWNQPLPGERGIEIKYVDNAGVNQTVTTPVANLTTALSSYQDASQLSYRSLFLPDSTSIDVFSVAYANITLPTFERKLDKSKFAVQVLPTDATDNHGWLMPNLWNENYGTPGFATRNGTDQWFTFNMGQTVTLSRFRVWQANDRYYKGESVKKFEIWGSAVPNPDGSWASWTKLMDCQSVKPSGSPVGTNTQADIDYANAGEEYLLPAGAPSVKYIRIKVLETWGNQPFITFSEFTFWTHDR